MSSEYEYSKSYVNLKSENREKNPYVMKKDQTDGKEFIYRNLTFKH